MARLCTKERKRSGIYTVKCSCGDPECPMQLQFVPDRQGNIVRVWFTSPEERGYCMRLTVGGVLELFECLLHALSDLATEEVVTDDRAGFESENCRNCAECRP
jgi:hypothetical protein